MAQYVTPSQLSGLYKESYSDDLENLIPECALNIKLIPFVESSKELGNK